VKFTQTAMEALRSHRTLQNEERLSAGAGWADMGLVFPNRLGKPMDAGNLYHRDWKNLLERAGLADRGFTFHALRHTFATTLLRQNISPKIVQHQLGHPTISQTMDTYSHVMPDMGSVAAEALRSRAVLIRQWRRMASKEPQRGRRGFSLYAICRDFRCAPGRIRTCDRRIRSPLLCPLSYGRIRLIYTVFSLPGSSRKPQWQQCGSNSFPTVSS
jgi:hypothetical protein